MVMTKVPRKDHRDYKKEEEFNKREKYLESAAGFKMGGESGFSISSLNAARDKLKLDRELYAKEQQAAYEKDRVNEKQVRALRNRFGTNAALLSANPRGIDVSESTNLPTKLGSA